MATLWQQGSPVQSIAFDDPWLAAALDDGSALLLNVDAAMRGGRSSKYLASSDNNVWDADFESCTWHHAL